MNQNILDSPCVFCGYCAAGYYQSGTHGKDCPWREVGGLVERESALREVIKSLFAKLVAAEARAEAAEGRIKTLEAANASWKRYHDAGSAAHERAEKAEARAGRLREALGMVEWVGEGEYFGECPWCENIRPDGHAPDCARQAALSPAATAEQQEKEDCPGCGRPSLSELPGVFKEGEGPCKHCGWTDDAEQPAPREVSESEASE